MPSVVIWMELETLIVSEENQKEKDKYQMISLISGIQYMAQMNLSTEKKETHGQGEQTCGFPGEGEGVGRTGSLSLVDANYYIWSG